MFSSNTTQIAAWYNCISKGQYKW